MRARVVLIIVLALCMAGRWLERRLVVQRLDTELASIAAARSTLMAPDDGPLKLEPSPVVILRTPDREIPRRLRVPLERAAPRRASVGTKPTEPRARFFSASKTRESRPRVSAIIADATRARVKLAVRSRSRWFEEGELCGAWEVTHIAPGEVILVDLRRGRQRVLRPAP